MSVPGESYEQWRERTAPAQPVPTVNPRTWDWGVIVFLSVFFVWVGTGSRGWSGLALPLVLAAEAIVHGRWGSALGERYDHVLRGATLLVTLVLSGWIIWVEGGLGAVLPVLLVLLDLKDDRSFLRSIFGRLRGRRAERGFPG